MARRRKQNMAIPQLVIVQVEPPAEKKQWRRQVGIGKTCTCGGDMRIRNTELSKNHAGAHQIHIRRWWCSACNRTVKDVTCRTAG